jgi:hypothetical protein
MPRGGVADEDFFGAYEAFTGKKLSTARGMAGNVPGSPMTRAARLQMQINEKKLSDMGKEIESTTGHLAQYALEHNLFATDLKHLREDKLRELENAIGDKAFAKVNSALDVVTRQIQAGTFDLEGFIRRQTETPQMPPQDTSNGKKPEFKVTIQRIEVQSDDPSRFVVGLTETVRDAVRNRSAAYDTLAEGS